ncbi:MAG: DUF4129 domain-containing protein [Micromonosporaceae bacterium]
MNRAAQRWLPLAAVAALLGAAMFAAVFANPRIEYLPADAPVTAPVRNTTPTAQPTPGPTVSSRPPSAGAQWSIPDWLSWLLTGVCAVAVLIIVVIVVWMMLRERLMLARGRNTGDDGELPSPPVSVAKVRAVVSEGLADLDVSDRDPRRAIIACWVRLEQAAAAAGIERLAGDTSTDLVTRMLGTHHVDARVLDEFAAVYREARYATHTVDEAMRDQARAALRQLRDELVVGVS